MRRLLPAIAFLTLAGCDFDLGNTFKFGRAFSDAQICRAATGLLVQQSPNSITEISSSGSVVKFELTRYDGMQFRSECKVKDSEVLWQQGFLQEWSPGARLFYTIAGDDTLELRMTQGGDRVVNVTYHQRDVIESKR